MVETRDTTRCSGHGPAAGRTSLPPFTCSARLSHRGSQIKLPSSTCRFRVVSPHCTRHSHHVRQSACGPRPMVLSPRVTPRRCRGHTVIGPARRTCWPCISTSAATRGQTQVGAHPREMIDHLGDVLSPPPALASADPCRRAARIPFGGLAGPTPLRGREAIGVEPRARFQPRSSVTSIGAHSTPRWNNCSRSRARIGRGALGDATLVRSPPRPPSDSRGRWSLCTAGDVLRANAPHRDRIGYGVQATSGHQRLSH
jgi:hypothetical protein